jgi:AcrR family transcriptional regulator/DNA-binding HxlR family transcriptional regulator
MEDVLARRSREPSSRELLADLGGGRPVHLNHRSVWVLGVVGGEPGLSNKEIAARAGGLGKGHICVLLRRLLDLGLIENMEVDPTPYVANAWRLTDIGRELERAISREQPGSVKAKGSRADAGNRGGTSQRTATAAGLADPRAARMVAAVVSIAYAEGVQAVSVERVVRDARVPREAFDELFGDRDTAVLAAFEYSLARAAERMGTLDAHDGWLERVRAGVLALLEFFDEQPALAALLVVHSAEAGPVLRSRRSEVLARLAWLLDDERAPARRYPPPLTAEAAVSGALGVISERLIERKQRPLVEMSGSLMSFIVMPFLGAGAARKELERPAVTAHAVSKRAAALELLHGFSGRAMRHPLAPRVLRVIHAEPGLSNIEIAKRAGVVDEGHMSRVLARLARLGLIENRQVTDRAGPKSWHLTGSGEELQQALQHEIRGAGAGGAAPTSVVSQTCPAIYGVRVAAWSNHRHRRGAVFGRSCERLVRLDPCGLPLLHYIRRP